MKAHDRGERAAGASEPRSPTIPLSQNAVLRMQREAGNAAVAQALGVLAQPRETAHLALQRDGDTSRHGPETGPALEEIHKLQDLHARKEKIAPGREDEAKINAVNAGQHVVNQMSRAGGNEILAAIGELQRNLMNVKNARYRGYQDALAFLTLKQFDDEASAGAQRSFLLSLAGNLLWALSGLIAITPMGLEARLATSLAGAWGKGVDVSRLTSKLMQLYAVRRAKLAVAAGTAGAMLAQFANGLPDMGMPGSQVSTSLIDAKTQFDALNAALFADLDLMLYDLILVPLDGYKPSRTQDAAHVVGQLIAATRSVAFAGYVESGRIAANQGDRIDETGIQQDARDSLLRRWLAHASGIRKGHIAATTTTVGGSGNKTGAKLVTSAVELLGGEQKLGFGPYDLVIPKVRQAAATFGLAISLDEPTFLTTLQQTVGSNKTLTIHGLGFDKKALAPEKLAWLHSAQALDWESLDTSGAVPPISGIDSMVIEPADLSMMTIDKQKIFSLEKVTFNCSVDYGGTENPYRYQKTKLVFHLDSDVANEGRSPLGAW